MTLLSSSAVLWEEQKSFFAWGRRFMAFSKAQECIVAG
jgi:hypothetical protein